MEKAIQNQIESKFVSLIAEGVAHFPKSNISPTSFNPYEKIKNCQLCSLANTRKKVHVNPQINPKKFFVVNEFPTQEDNNSQEDLIIKLLDKLGILASSHLSYALKCVPEKGIPKNALKDCSTNNLKIELDYVTPEFILCFGHRAILAIKNIFSSNAFENLCENNSCVSLEAGPSVYYLSSCRDLFHYPHWRSQVWQSLEHFKVKK